MLTQRRFDVLIVGMGPAGISAACAAAEGGLQVGVVDDNPTEGGQIWRGETTTPSSKHAAGWLARFQAASVDTLRETRVVGAPTAGVLSAEHAGSPLELQYTKLILATGARERFLPFPGWTLPNVMGAGGLQAMVKGGVEVEGKRVVVAGTGPLLFAVAAYLRKHGAFVSLIAEQTGWTQLARFGLSMALKPSKLIQGINLKWALRGIPYLNGCWPVEAVGDQQLSGVVLRTSSKTWREPCDFLACGFGLVPNLELPLLLGCEIRNGFVAVNESCETSQPNVYCAGEPNGIGGVDLALIEGQIAGFAAAGLADRAKQQFPAHARAVWLRAALEQAFALRDELRAIARPDTIVCRCEDVPLDRLRVHPAWRSAKLQTRCGMGPCQGRICGPAIEFLLGWKHESVRPPIFPVRVDHITQQVDA